MFDRSAKLFSQTASKGGTSSDLNSTIDNSSSSGLADLNQAISDKVGLKPFSREIIMQNSQGGAREYHWPVVENQSNDTQQAFAGLLLNNSQSEMLVRICSAHDPLTVAVRKGDSGPQVGLLKTLLNYLGLNETALAINDLYDDQTFTAVRRAEKELGTGVTKNGEAGPRLFSRLFVKCWEMASSMSIQPRIFEDDSLNAKWETVVPLLKATSRPIGTADYQDSGELIASYNETRQKHITAQQKVLRDLGYDIAAVDGVFKVEDQRAIDKFCLENNLNSRGKVDVLKALIREYFSR